MTGVQTCALPISPGGGGLPDPKWAWHWRGWLKGLSQPSGAISVLENNFVKDGSPQGNPVEPSAAAATATTVAAWGDAYAGAGAPHTASIDTTLGALIAGSTYGIWDTFAPDLASIWTSPPSPDPWSTRIAYEAIPVDLNGNARFAAVEMHIFDNATFDDLTATAPTGDMTIRWSSNNGWFLDDVTPPGDMSSGLFRDYPDTRGGARPWRATTVSPTGIDAPRYLNADHTVGGIRDSSLGAAAWGAFSLRESDVKNSVATNAYNSGIDTVVLSSFFDTVTNNPVNKADDPYFRLLLNDSSTSYPWTAASRLLMSYSETGRVTDLAGNILASFTDRALVDKVPPRFRFSLALADSATAAGTATSTKVYVQFNKPINIGGLHSFMSLKGMGGVFQLSDPAITVSKIDFIDSVTGAIIPFDPAQAISPTISPNELMLTLSKTLGATDILSTTINPVQATTKDPITGKNVSSGSNILDRTGNAQANTDTHRVTDLALNLINMSAATDGVHEGPAQLAQGQTDAATSALGALRVFDGSGKLLVRDITLYSALNTGAPQNLPLSLYYDMSRSIPQDAALSPSITISGHTDSGLFWLPSILPGFNLTANTDARGITPFSVAPAPSVLRSFRIPGNDKGMKDGADVGFLFSYGGLYAARSTDPEDPRRFDLFRFKVGEAQTQRGSVTILNNVINPTKGERTALQVTLSAAGNLAVTIFTLDGDSVRRLYLGRQAAGTYTYFWDGTNASGSAVARGIYFIRVIGPNIDEIRKVLIVR